MQVQLLAAFQVLDRNASTKDVLEACRQLFIESDQYTHSREQPFDRDEVDAVANAIYGYLLDPDNRADREIVFKVSRQLEGRSIEYCEYASMFSEDMLYQNYSKKFASLDLESLRRALKTFLAGILFRYQFCVNENRAAFPVSEILYYMEAVKTLFLREQREDELSAALWTTLRTLASLDRLQRMAEEVARLMARRTPKGGGEMGQG